MAHVYVTSPKSPAAEPGFSPAVGEMCEGENRHTGDTFRGKFLGFRLDDAKIEDTATPNNPWLVTRSSLRLATPAASEETYGTQPDPLPETLPDGAVWAWSGHRYRLFDVELRGGSYYFDRAEDCAGGSLALESRPTKWACDPAEIDWASIKRPSPQPVPAADDCRCGMPSNHAGGLRCPEVVYDDEPPEQPGQSHPSVWGIPRAKEAAKRAPTTCNEPGCNCPYCRNRAFSPKFGANDPRYNAGRGPAHSALDLSIASARRAKGEVDAHPRNWPEQISTATYED